VGDVYPISYLLQIVLMVKLLDIDLNFRRREALYVANWADYKILSIMKKMRDVKKTDEVTKEMETNTITMITVTHHFNRYLVHLPINGDIQNIQNMNREFLLRYVV
jgi:hypothetical protein